MAFRIKKYPTKKAKKMPLVGFGQGSKDLTTGPKVSHGSGGGPYPAWPPLPPVSDILFIANGKIMKPLSGVNVVNGILTIG